MFRLNTNQGNRSAVELTEEVPVDAPVSHAESPQALPLDHPEVALTIVMDLSDEKRAKSVTVFGADKKNGVMQICYGKINPDDTVESIGKLCERSIFIDGKKTGPEEHWYPSGKLLYQMYWLGGHKHGVQRSFHENGAIRLEDHFVNGIIHGTCSTYDADGVLQWKQNYVRGFSKN